MHLTLKEFVHVRVGWEGRQCVRQREREIDNKREGMIVYERERELQTV